MNALLALGVAVTGYHFHPYMFYQPYQLYQPYFGMPTQWQIPYAPPHPAMQSTALVSAQQVPFGGSHSRFSDDFLGRQGIAQEREMFKAGVNFTIDLSWSGHNFNHENKNPVVMAAFNTLKQELMKANDIPQDQQLTGGGIGTQQATYYLNIAANPKVKTICETGFFKGVSTAMWLTASNAVVHSFDLQFAEPSVKLLEAKFPGRLHTHAGDSKATLAAFQEKCDLIVVDGSHEKEGVLNDIKLFQKNSHAGTLLVSDDTFDCNSAAAHCTECNSCDCGAKPFCNGCAAAWTKLVQDKTISQVGCIGPYWKEGQQSKDYPNGYCVGHYS